MGLSLALASIARTRAETAFTMAHTALAELGGSGQRTAYRRGVGRCPAMCSAWPTIRGRGMGEIDRAQTRFGIHHASAWPSESPTCARRTKQRGLTPLIDETSNGGEINKHVEEANASSAYARLIRRSGCTRE